MGLFDYRLILSGSHVRIPCARPVFGARFQFIPVYDLSKPILCMGPRRHKKNPHRIVRIPSVNKGLTTISMDFRERGFHIRGPGQDVWNRYNG